MDVHGLTPAERIRSRVIAPERISLRILLPAESTNLPYPRARTDRGDLRPRDRLHAITRRHRASPHEVVCGLTAEKLVPSADLEIRHVELTPAFKLYVLNGQEVRHGLDEVIERPVVPDTLEEVQALDVLGVGSTPTRHVADADPDSPGSVFVAGPRSWCASVWRLLAG